MKYPLEHLFLVCIGPRCNAEARGIERGDPIRVELKEQTRVKGRKGSVRVCGVTCLDLCNFGPIMVAQPSGNVYSHLTTEDATRAYEGECGDAPLAEDLILEEEEFRRIGRGKEKVSY